VARNLWFVIIMSLTLAVLSIAAAGHGSAPKKSAIRKDTCIGWCAAACQQMVIWYWYRQYGKEDVYLREHDIKQLASGPVSVAIINWKLSKVKIPVQYVEYKAEYDQQTKQMMPTHWEQVIDSLLTGHPVICFSDISDDGKRDKTHAFLLVGYDKKTGLFYANDTYYKKIPVGKDKAGHLIWSKIRIEPKSVQVLGDQDHLVLLTQENLEKHRRPNEDGCIFYYVPARREINENSDRN